MELLNLSVRSIFTDIEKWRKANEFNEHQLGWKKMFKGGLIYIIIATPAIFVMHNYFSSLDIISEDLLKFIKFLGYLYLFMFLVCLLLYYLNRNQTEYNANKANLGIHLNKLIEEIKGLLDDSTSKNRGIIEWLYKPKPSSQKILQIIYIISLNSNYLATLRLILERRGRKIIGKYAYKANGFSLPFFLFFNFKIRFS